MHPEVDDYKLYYAQVCCEQIVWRVWFVHMYRTVHYSFFPIQSLHRACSYPEAMKVSCQIENQAYQARVCIRVLYTCTLVAQIIFVCCSVLMTVV